MIYEKLLLWCQVIQVNPKARMFLCLSCLETIYRLFSRLGNLGMLLSSCINVNSVICELGLPTHQLAFEIKWKDPLLPNSTRRELAKIKTKTKHRIMKELLHLVRAKLIVPKHITHGTNHHWIKQSLCRYSTYHYILLIEREFRFKDNSLYNLT